MYTIYKYVHYALHYIILALHCCNLVSNTAVHLTYFSYLTVTINSFCKAIMDFFFLLMLEQICSYVTP